MTGLCCLLWVVSFNMFLLSLIAVTDPDATVMSE